MCFLASKTWNCWFEMKKECLFSGRLDSNTTSSVLFQNPVSIISLSAHMPHDLSICLHHLIPNYRAFTKHNFFPFFFLIVINGATIWVHTFWLGNIRRKEKMRNKTGWRIYCGKIEIITFYFYTHGFFFLFLFWYILRLGVECFCIHLVHKVVFLCRITLYSFISRRCLPENCLINSFCKVVFRGT